MADYLPSPPASRSSTPNETANTDALTARLDELLEQYLELLHAYTTLREKVSKTFSSGFFSLAQAQRTSTLGAGRRYGEECYDERMKAQKNLSWDVDSDTKVATFSIQKEKQEHVTRNGPNTEKTEVVGGMGVQEEDTPQRNSENKDEGKDASESHPNPSHPKKSMKSKVNPADRNPLTWFGILVPPALRQTQTQFVEFIDEQLLDLAKVKSTMIHVEQEIWEIREQLGISSEYREVGNTRQRPQEDSSNPKEVNTTSRTKDSKSSRNSAVSRPVHSQLHLLELGD